MSLLTPIERICERLLRTKPQRYQGVMGIYYYIDDAVDAVTALRQMGHADLSVYSPVPHHQIEHAMEQGPSLVRWITATGAVLGITGGFALCIYASMSYPLVVGGKELYSLPPFVVVGYESMILLGSLANLVGMLALGRLPALKSKAPYDPRFSEDRIGIWVPVTGEAAVRVQEAMKGHGAEEVQVHA